MLAGASCAMKLNVL